MLCHPQNSCPQRHCPLLCILKCVSLLWAQSVAVNNFVVGIPQKGCKPQTQVPNSLSGSGDGVQGVASSPSFPIFYSKLVLILWLLRYQHLVAVSERSCGPVCMRSTPCKNTMEGESGVQVRAWWGLRMRPQVPKCCDTEPTSRVHLVSTQSSQVSQLL